MTKGEISENNAKKEYLLTSEDLDAALAKGTLQFVLKKIGKVEYRSFPLDLIKTLSASRPPDATREKDLNAYALKEIGKKLSKALKKKTGSSSGSSSSTGILSSSTGKTAKPLSEKALEKLEKVIVDLQTQQAALQSEATAPAA